MVWAVENGITTGTGANTFSPYRPCTRAEVVTLLWRALSLDESSARAQSNPFVDVENDDYFRDAVLWAAEYGITSGTDKSHFSPDKTCTRAEVVTFLYRYFGDPAYSAKATFYSMYHDGRKGKY